MRRYIFSLRASSKFKKNSEPFTNSLYKRIWNDEQRDIFLRKLMSRLPDVNNIFDNINRRDRKSVNDAVCDFVDVINNVATPLFRKQVNIQPDGCLRINHSARAKGFDNECREKKEAYTDALGTFNLEQSAVNRQNVCDKKNMYKKNLIKRKRRKYQFETTKKIENLRQKNSPKTLGNFVKARNHLRRII